MKYALWTTVVLYSVFIAVLFLSIAYDAGRWHGEMAEREIRYQEVDAAEEALYREAAARGLAEKYQVPGTDRTFWVWNAPVPEYEKITP